MLGPGAILRYACIYSATLLHTHTKFVYSDMCVCKGIWSVTNPSLCLHKGCPSHGFEKFVGYDLGRHLEYVKC